LGERGKPVTINQISNEARRRGGVGKKAVAGRKASCPRERASLCKKNGVRKGKVSSGTMALKKGLALDLSFDEGIYGSPEDKLTSETGRERGGVHAEIV